jgi:hypothetical protein
MGKPAPEHTYIVLSGIDRSFLGYSLDRKDLSAGRLTISTVNTRYQETAVEDTANGRRVFVAVICTAMVLKLLVVPSDVSKSNYQYSVYVEPG